MFSTDLTALKIVSDAIWLVHVDSRTANWVGLGRTVERDELVCNFWIDQWPDERSRGCQTRPILGRIVFERSACIGHLLHHEDEQNDRSSEPDQNGPLILSRILRTIFWWFTSTNGLDAAQTRPILQQYVRLNNR